MKIWRFLLGGCAACTVVTACPSHEPTSKSGSGASGNPWTASGGGGAAGSGGQGGGAAPEASAASSSSGGGEAGHGVAETCAFPSNAGCTVGYCTLYNECHGIAVCVASPTHEYRCDDSTVVASMAITIEEGPLTWRGQTGCWGGSSDFISCIDGQECRVRLQSPPDLKDPYRDGICRHDAP